MILVKLPTRERPEKFLKVLSMYIEKSARPKDIHYLISVDDDDKTMTDLGIRERAGTIIEKSGGQMTFCIGTSNNKVEAINRDIEKVRDWDILVSGADDMVCVYDGWDERIRKDMAEHFPNLDGGLWYFDGRQERICTMSIIGRNRYNHFGYIYYPGYATHCPDEEYTRIGERDGKLIKFNKILFEHEHPAHNPKGVWDNLYRKNEDRILSLRDKKIFEERSKNGFI